MKISDIVKTERKICYLPMGVGKEIYWKANMLGCEGTGDNKNAALCEVIHKVKKTIENTQETPVVRWAKNGVVFVLSFCNGNWCYEIIKPNMNGGPLAVLSAKTKTDALEQMEQHAKEYE